MIQVLTEEIQFWRPRNNNMIPVHVGGVLYSFIDVVKGFLCKNLFVGVDPSLVI